MAGKNEGNNVLVIPNEVFFSRITESLAAGRNVTFTVKGYSMFPFMRNEKDRVCLERYDGRELSAGEVILFRYNGKYILHCTGYTLQGPMPAAVLSTVQWGTAI